MKLSHLILACALCLAPVINVGCPTVPNQRVVAVQTLLAVGQTAEVAVELSAQLYKEGTITASQARSVIDLYNGRFLPVFRAAVTAAKSDLSTLASTDLARLASELVALVGSFTPSKTL